MRPLCVALLSSLVAIPSAGVPPSARAQARPLAVGDPAPDFSLPGSDGKTYRLSELRGKVVVLAWFAKAFSGG